jgi:ribosomal protein RSM22 (predicted rRNA methylase)
MWRAADVATDAIDCAPRDLVAAAYVLNELAPSDRPPLLQKLWQVTADTLVIVEPGTPAGWQRILAARSQLIESGAHVIAPCPHARACPLREPDWCHFAVRVARSRPHRQTKGAEVPWEDEKFSYLAASREPAPSGAARVIARPRKASGRVTLKLCRPDGSAGDELYSRRDGAAFKRAARSDWGSSL